MIDTDKYEGHTPAPWKASHDAVEYGHIVNNTGWRVYVGEHEKRAEIQNYRFNHDELSEANAQLIADAPLLLEEVKRLREENQRLLDYLIQVADEYTDADGVTYEIYCEFGDDEND
jgi:hypothetical protein